MLIRNLFVFLILCCSSALSYKILMVCSPPSKSHYNLCSAVTNTLVERNHEVTFISAYGAGKPTKYKEIVVEMTTIFNHLPSVFKMMNMSAVEAFPNLLQMSTLVTEKMFDNPQVKKMMLDKSENYDLVILEYFINQHFLGFSVKYNCPAVLLAGIGMMPWVAIASDNPLSSATVPSFITKYPVKMNILERALNTLIYAFQYLTEVIYFSPTLAKLYNQYFVEESKTVGFYELQHKVAAILSNTHPSIGPARPFQPNVAEIAGYHIEDPAPLPQDLQKIMDTSKDGVIFFSMGSVVRTNEMSPQFREAIIKSLSKFKQTILWKFDEDLKDLPKNIITRKWLPQTALLAHPNLKLFITHGGFLSCTEATHFAKPILMIPVFGDQSSNARLFTERGQGLTLVYNEVTESSLTTAVTEILNNPKYAETSKSVSAIYHDRPVKPKDLLAYQIEHVIRSGGGSHLSPPYLPKYSHLLLDVLALILIPIIGVVLLLCCVCRKIFCKKSNPEKKVKKN